MNAANLLGGVAAFFGVAAMSQAQTVRDAAVRLLDGFKAMPSPQESANLRAFLHMIRVGEGTADPDGYRRLFGGELVATLADHPRRPITRRAGAGYITSTAAGAYQFLSRTWDECADALDLPDFSPASQDRAAVYLIRRRGALSDVLAGRLDDAIRKCALEWASLPGSPYGQPTKTMQQAAHAYEAAGGAYA